VWDDAFFKRDGVASWQAVDATPQEESDGRYQMGPASLRDIHRRNITQPYDVAFVTMEVTALIENYVRESPDAEYSLYSTLDSSTGLFMSTKMPGSNLRLDVTGQYKSQIISLARARLTNDEGWSLAIGVTCPVVLVGTDIAITLEIGLFGTGPLPLLPLAVRAHVAATFMDYTTNHTSSPIKLYVNGSLASATRKLLLHVKLPATMYTRTLKEGHHYLGLEASAMTDATDVQPGIGSLRTSLTIPELNISLGKSRYQIGEFMTGRASFSNPLDLPLTHVFISAQASAGVLIPPVEVGDVGPRGQLVIPVNVPALVPGTHLFIATLSSDQLSHVVGSVQVTIEADTSVNPVLGWVAGLPVWMSFLFGVLACALLTALIIMVYCCIKRRRMIRHIADAGQGQQLINPLTPQADTVDA